MHKKESIGIKGIYKIVEAKVTKESVEFAEKFIKNAVDETARFFAIREYNRLFGVREETIKNVVTNNALESISNHWFTDIIPASESLKVTYHALGTGTSTPSGSDTQLQTEVYRQLVSSKSFVDGVFRTSLFLDLNTGNDVIYSEFGMFAGDATATANSGMLSTRLLISPTFEKTSQNTLSIETSHTFTSL